MQGFRSKQPVVCLLLIILTCISLFPIIDNIVGAMMYEGNDGWTGDGRTGDGWSGDSRRGGIPSRLSHLLWGRRMAQREREGAPQYYNYPEETGGGELFIFDPNTADSTQLLRLGLSPWQVRNIYKYRAKGGRYRQPSDFARLYGLTAKKYRELLPYIVINNTHESMAAELYGSTTHNRYRNRYPNQYLNGSFNGGHSVTADNNNISHASDNGNAHAPGSGASASRDIDPTIFRNYPVKLKVGETININVADTAALKRIPGIGSYFAKRIVYRRQQLGGLYSPEQLLEIENFPVSSLSFMTVGAHATGCLPQGVTPIRINSTDARTLSRHPYIKYLQAKQIEEYRSQRGNLRSVDDLYRIPSFTPQEIERLAPYLVF